MAFPDFPVSLFSLNHKRHWGIKAWLKLPRCGQDGPLMPFRPDYLRVQNTAQRCLWSCSPFFLEGDFACHHEISGLKQALWFAMEASVVTTKPVQRSSDLQPVRAPCSVAALKQKLVAFSAWVGGLVYAFTNVYSQVWKLFGMIFYLCVIRVARFWVWGGGGGSIQRRATEQVWQELKHQQWEAPSAMTGRWRTDYYCLKSHR